MEGQMTSVFLAVDAANLYRSLRTVLPAGARLNYRALLDWAGRLGRVTTSAIYVPGDSALQRERDFLLALKHLGYSRVVCRPPRLRPNGVLKSDLDISLALDIWEDALRGDFQVAVIASGDGDFVPLIERLICRGIEAHVVGPDHCTAWEMKVVATRFANVSDVPNLVGPGAAVSEGASEEPAARPDQKLT